MEYQTVVTSVADCYTKSPIEFTVELDIQSRLTESLRTELRESNSLYSEFVNERIEYTGQTQNYKESYVDHFLKKVGSAENPFSRVHTEVTPYEDLIGDTAPRERIDVVVFKENIENPIKWRGGSQRHHWDDYDAALEVKYVKNKAKFPADVSQTEIAQSSMQDLQTAVDLEENSIAPDIEELERLPDSTERYLMLISNHDYLYRGSIPDLDQQRQQRYSRLADAAIHEIQHRTEGTRVLYVHPTGWQWITGNSIQSPQSPDPGEST